MGEKDYSKEIYDKYYNPKGEVLEIIFKDNSVLDGIIVGFFHGDAEAGESYVIKWHFIPTDERDKYHHALSTETKLECGRMIKQEDIKEVRFKNG